MRTSARLTSASLDKRKRGREISPNLLQKGVIPIDENRIAELMKKLDLTRAEAIEVLEADAEIDKGGKLFELTPEQKQAEKKARQADRKPITFDRKPRERKQDPDKRELIELLAQAVGECEVTNPEREIIFTRNGRKFKIVLSAPRS